MLEEQATVVSVEPGIAWVEADRRKGCERCEAGEGCGGGVLGRLVVRGTSRVRALCEIADLAVGDNVVLGLDERLLLQGSLMTYLMPLICMLAAAIFADQLLVTTDLGVAAFGALGLGLGLLLLRGYTNTLLAKGEMQPRVLRRTSAHKLGCQIQPTTNQ